LIEKNVTKNSYPTDSLLKIISNTDNTIYPKQLEENFRKKYQSQEFNYTQSNPRESLWDRVKRNITKLINKLLDKINPTKSLSIIEVLIKVIAVIVIGVILYFLIKFLISKNGNLIWSKRNIPNKIQDVTLQENIHEIDFAKEISQFELSGNYRFAIRYQFLWVLKKMSDQKIIQWNIEKTNKDYQKELLGKPQQNSFRDLVRIFDYVWYGEFPITTQQYQQYKSQFQHII
jgi:hypothetical protein